MNDLEQEEAVARLSEMVLQVVPKAQLVNKYGGILFTLKPNEKEGQFCGIFQYQSHVQIVFSRGAELKDPKKQLAGNGKLRRHLNYDSIDELDETVLKRFIKQAAKL